MPLNFPRYAFRRTNGSFRNKCSVAQHLRPLTGTEALYRQLGDSYRAAMQVLTFLTARIGALLNHLTNRSASELSLALIQDALRDEVAELVLPEAVPEYCPIEDAINELGQSPYKQKMPAKVV